MLELKKLEMTNFGPIEGTKIINYKKGLNLIQAENGKGKSNSISAIELLLIDNYEGSLEQFINYNRDFFALTLDFAINNEDFTLFLECKKGKSATTSKRILFDKNGELASGEDVKKYMAKMLNPEITKYALTAKQKAVDNITTCSDSERRELFKKIRSLDFEKKINTYILPRLETTKEEIVDLDKKIYALETKSYNEMTISELPFTEEEYKEKEARVKQKESEKVLIEEKLKQKNSIETSISKLRKTISERENLIEDLQNKISKIDSERQFLKNFDNLKTDIENECKKAKQTLDEDYLELDKALKKEKEDTKEKYISEEKNLNEKVFQIEEEINTIKLVKLAKFDNESLEKIKEQLILLNTQKSQCLKNISYLEKGVCPVCGQTCEHKLEDYQKELASIDSEIAKLTEEKNEKENEKRLYEEKFEQNRQAKERKEILLSKLEVLRETIKNVQNQISNVDSLFQEKMVVLEQKKERELQNILLKEEKGLQNLENMKNEYERLEKEEKQYLSQNAVDMKEVEDLENSLESYKDLQYVEGEITEKKEIEEYNNILHSISIAQDYNLKLQEEKSKDSKELTKIKKEKENLKKQQFDLESARNILLKDFPNFVIDQSVESIEYAMNQFIENIYYKPLDVSLRATKTSIKLEYGNGQRKLPANRLSGAESKLVSLSFINNFNKLLGLSCIILDEPDSAMDAERKKDLYSILLSMSDIYSQMIIITHSQDMTNYMMANTESNLILL